MYKREVVARGINVHYNAHMAYRTGIATTAKEHEIALLKVRNSGDGGALCVLRARRAQD